MVPVNPVDAQPTLDANSSASASQPTPRAKVRSPMTTPNKQ